MRVVWVNESAIQSSSFHEFNFKAHSYCFSAKPLYFANIRIFELAQYIFQLCYQLLVRHINSQATLPDVFFHHGYGPVQAGAAVSTFLLSYFVFLFPELIVFFYKFQRLAIEYSLHLFDIPRQQSILLASLNLDISS